MQNDSICLKFNKGEMKKLRITAQMIKNRKQTKREINTQLRITVTPGGGGQDSSIIDGHGSARASGGR